MSLIIRKSRRKGLEISTIKKNYGLFDTFNLNNYKYLLVSSKKI